MENNTEPLSGAQQLEGDPFSNLPDDLLVSILSILTFKEAAQTSILSHRWERLWMHVPFRTSKRNIYMHVFTNLVNHVLDFRGRSYLQEFKIICELDKSKQSERLTSGSSMHLGLELNLARSVLTAPSVALKTDVYNFPNKLLHQIQKLSCCLSQLTTLSLESDEPEEIMMLYKFPEVQNLRRLVLISHHCCLESMIGLTSFIESCPNLVEFALMMSPAVGLRRFRLYQDQKPATEESVKRLKVFEYYGYHGKYEFEDELMMFFIKNAVALEKIVIDPHDLHVDYMVLHPLNMSVQKNREDLL